MFQSQYNPYSSQYQIDQLNNRIRQNQSTGYGQMYAANSMPPIVYGKHSAENAMTPPNSRVLLMDGELPRVYLKETDATGAYKLTAYDLTEVKDEVAPSPEYITRQEFEEWKKGFLNEPTVRKSTTDDDEPKSKSIEHVKFSDF